METNVKQNSQTSCQTIGEEIANSILHGIGGLLGVVGLALLVINAQSAVPVYVIFASAMILMFTASAVYHALCPKLAHNVAEKVTKIGELFQTFDHQAIYIFIAGTYTPFCLLALKGALGWVIFGFEWALALTGIILSAVKCRFLKKAELVIFLLMGWTILVATIPLAHFLSFNSLIFLFAGGLFYTAGTVFYRLGKAKPAKTLSGVLVKERKRLVGGHVIWHLFVLAGAACHWLSVWFLCLNV